MNPRDMWARMANTTPNTRRPPTSAATPMNPRGQSPGPGPTQRPFRASSKAWVVV